LLAGNIHFPQIGPSLDLSTARGKLMHTIIAGQRSSSASPRPDRNVEVSKYTVMDLVKRAASNFVTSHITGGCVKQERLACSRRSKAQRRRAAATLAQSLADQLARQA
jgi:hypothetical protein